MKWYKFDVDFFLDVTQGLSNDEELAYRRLIDAYYITEKPLPKKMDDLLQLTGVTEYATQYVLEKFFYESPQGWRDDAIDFAIGKHQRQVQINTELGKKGGRPKSTKTAEKR